MAQLDHIAVIAPTLKDGMLWVRDCLGVMPGMGGQHPQMGTHNLLLRLGEDAFLEIIAIDPNAPTPAHPRWFGLDATDDLARHWQAGRRLRGMVARTDHLEALAAVDPGLHGQPMRLTRGTRSWLFAVRADGALPAGGAVPHLMDWGAQGPAGPTLPDVGCRLLSLVLETPDVTGARAHFAALNLQAPPHVRPGPHIKLSAVIQTPTGTHLLT
jgi:Glyoxalase-like domain